MDECTMAPKETLWHTRTQRLSIGPRDGAVNRWQPVSPAMAAGGTDHGWTRHEGLLCRVPPWPQPPMVYGVGNEHDRDAGRTSVRASRAAGSREILTTPVEDGGPTDADHPDG